MIYKSKKFSLPNSIEYQISLLISSHLASPVLQLANMLFLSIIRTFKIRRFERVKLFSGRMHAVPHVYKSFSSIKKMTAICNITFRPAEMVQFDSNFNVWNAQWGLSNFGTQGFQTDANQKAVLMPVAGLYRVTGSIMGSMNAAGLAQAFVNTPPAQLVHDQHNPDYPFPYDLGARQQEAGNWITLPFCGLLQVQNANAPISFYMSNTFQPDDPHATILIELIQPS